MRRNTLGCPRAPLPPSQATVRESTWMISVGVTGIPVGEAVLGAAPSGMLILCLVGKVAHDSDAANAFNRAEGSREGRCPLDPQQRRSLCNPSTVTRGVAPWRGRGAEPLALLPS